ncbi:TetR/AcrR family transcriptional regulator [Actinocrispum wychmicini]|uniref:TetR family transcriptional regulator n=1 Tax=Actinocrispum wychmicini TaxID=1213861 RepID=A0A4R2JAY9_9PSEU|nr:TetR/AcrR family transcriptional regulator [Actinocrispum wychmicini]TCO55052.1 TetR family transcriptional regulator [Actinocrispum wychmicini]
MATRKRLGRTDWTDAALEALAEGGLAAIAVEPIAARLNTTKGSFYWHFANRDALVAATLERWVDVHTEAVIREVGKAPPADRLDRLFATVFSHALENRVDLALLADADDPMVAPVLALVTERRVAFITECLLELGFTKQQARHRAVLAYTAYIGLVHAQRASGGKLLPVAARAGYLDFLKQALTP